MLDPARALALARVLGEELGATRRIAGGDINDAWEVTLSSGRRLFVKSRDDAPAGEYAAEAAGLRWLAAAHALPLPGVLAVVDGGHPPRMLALEWIQPGRLSAAGEEELGRGLAALHAAGAPAFGAGPPQQGSPEGAAALRLGAVTLPGEARPDWASFYVDCRLAPLVARARAAGALDAGAARRIEALCARMADLAGPPEPPARLHGDLWWGNVLAGADGRPHLIDPAAHGGHREVDLAMLRLFGAAPERVFSAYQEVAPLGDGHAERVALWQLLPLLVHAVLFGGGHGAAADRAARRYAR